MKTKPFEFKRAMAGDKVVTRRGTPVSDLVSFSRANSAHTIVGIVEGSILSWTRYGRYIDSETDHGNDLVMVDEAVEASEAWLNVYWHPRYLRPLVSSTCFTTERDAKDFAGRYCEDAAFDLLATIKVEIPGHGV